MVRLLREEIMVGFPDTQVFTQRGSLLSVDGDNSREIRLDFQGADLAALMDAARLATEEIPKAIPETFPQAFPGLELDQPELQLVPDEWRIARSGLTRTEVASAIRAYTGGLWAGEYFDGNDRLDIIVKSNEWHSPEELAELPIVTPQAGVQTVGELTELRQTVGPSQLVRVNGHRTVSVEFEPPEDMTLDEAIEVLETQVEPKVRAGMAPKVQLTYAGSVNDLHEALRAMGQNFLLALVILFALMAALFRSMRDSLLVMAVIPVSVAGGILALRVHRPVRLPGARPADDDRLHHPARPRRQRGDPARRPDAGPRAQRRAAPPGRGRGARDARAADRAVDADGRARHGAADLHAGARRRDLPRPRRRGRRRHDRRHALHLGPDAEPVAARRTRDRNGAARPTGDAPAIA